MAGVEFVTSGQVRELAEFEGGEWKVVSLYVGVDGRQYPRKSDYVAKTEALLRDARRSLKSTGLEKKVLSAAQADLADIDGYISGKFRRSSASGVAVFSCGRLGFFQAYALPKAPRDRIVVNASPYVRPLAALLSEYRRYGIVLIGRRTARIFAFYMGRLVEEEPPVEDEVHGRHEQGGWSQARFSRHIETEVARHLKHTAKEACTAFKRAGVERIVIAGKKDLVGEFEKALSREDRARVVATVDLKQSASIDEVAEAIQRIEARVEREEDDGLVEAIRAGLRKGRSVAGTTATLEALGEGRLETLLISRGYSAEGWKCGACGRISTIGPTCPACGAEMSRVPDVVEEAIEECVSRGLRSELVTGNGDLDVLGRVGALLRY